ncbi:MAG: transposase [Gemmataceae bacterium]|nr:transposase [Gemmataceae bacterium]
MDGAYLGKALARFSGYLAIDEVYDGPFCVLCVVDNRAFNRLACSVLGHAPTHEDVLGFLAGFKEGLGKRGKRVSGITADGSRRHPKALAESWPGVPHQVCEFHVLKEIAKAVLHALAGMRRRMKAEIPKRKRGRPPKEEEAAGRRIAERTKRVADLSEGRHLFVRHGLSAGQKEGLRRLTRGLPRLRVLQGIMDEAYRLFNRRCKTETGLAKLDRLRKRVKRLTSLGKALDKLKSPTLEKALEFLDDKLLPSTSNAVERSNRRFRKAQRAVYGVRTKTSLEQRVALDMHREQRTPRRKRTIKTLHRARSLARRLH